MLSQLETDAGKPKANSVGWEWDNSTCSSLQKFVRANKMKSALAIIVMFFVISTGVIYSTWMTKTELHPFVLDKRCSPELRMEAPPSARSEFVEPSYNLRLNHPKNFLYGEFPRIGDELAFLDDQCAVRFPTIHLRLSRFAKVLDNVFGARSADRCERFQRCMDEYFEAHKGSGEIGRFLFHNDSVSSSDQLSESQKVFLKHAKQAMDHVQLSTDMKILAYTGIGRSSLPIFKDSRGQMCTVPLVTSEAHPEDAVLLFPSRGASWVGSGSWANSDIRRTFKERKPVAIFRGSTEKDWVKSNLTEKIAYNLCSFGVLHPNYVDAKLTSIVKSSDDSLESYLEEHKVYGQKFSIPEEDMFKYKYLIAVEGNSNPDQFPRFLASGSLVFRSHPIRGSEVFSFRAKPWVHYIPFKEDLSDLIERIQWAKDHEEEAEMIAKQALEYITSNTNAFIDSNAVDYAALLFTRLSVLLKNYVNCS
jgi:hypothetical protein